MAGAYFFTVVKGEDFDAALTWTRNGSPVNLTGYTAKFVINDESGTQLTVTDVTLGGAAGTITIHIPAADLATAVITSSHYRLLMTSAAGKVKCLLFGQFAQEGAG